MSGFAFDSKDEEDLFRSMSSLVKFNNGLFKSEKQAAFLLKRVFKFIDSDVVVAEKRNWFGIDVLEGQFTLTINATMRWTDYGSRSIIPMMYVFVADEHGLVAQYKVPFNGNLRMGASPAPERTKLLWTRPTDLALPEVKVAEKEAKPVATSHHIGQVGMRVAFTGKVVAVRTFQTSSRNHYYDTGVRHQTAVEVDGNKVVYWNMLGDAQEGDEVQFTATIKEHSEYNGVKQTIVSRASKIVVTTKEVA